MLMKGETALVTGASKGIGRACALSLAAEGASLALIARGEKDLEEAAAAIRGVGARALALSGDVGDEGFAARAFELAERELGPVSVLVNNAGIVELAPVSELSLASWERVLRVNLTGSFLFAREAVRRMSPPQKGRLIFVSSASATLGLPGMSAYCASKWGVHGLVKSLAEELRCSGVLALGVAPGSVDTEMLRRAGFSPDMQPEDVARVVRFLATEAPAAMQGSIVEMFG